LRRLAVIGAVVGLPHGRLAHGGKVTVDLAEGEKIRLIFAEEPASVA